MIVHSMAGIVGCEAVNKILERSKYEGGKIIRIIFLAAFTSRTEIAEHFLRQGFMRIDFDRSLSFHERAELAFYNDMTTEEAQPYIEALTWQALYTQPELSSWRWRDVPLTYMLCSQDQAVLPSVQERIAREYGMQVVRIEAAHCPFISQPEKFVEVVEEILRS